MRLKEWRRAAGLTQQELAVKARVARSAISHIENERYAPSALFVKAMCRALGESLSCRLTGWQLFPEHFSALQDFED